MKNLFENAPKFFYQTDNFVLLEAECNKALSKIKTGSINMIFADPPYFLSNNGVSMHSGKQVSVNKADWDMGYDFKKKHSFNRKWIKSCKRVLADDGTIWISGTLHNIYSVGVALEQEGFQILNNITWQKKNPPPNLACRCFTHSTETVLWAKKKSARHYFDYPLMKSMNNNKQMKDVWTGTLTPQKEKKCGKHPTQKPLYLLEKIILSSTTDNQVILDPFNGSGTTGVAANNLNRRYIGIDIKIEYLALTVNRLKGERNE